MVPRAALSFSPKPPSAQDDVILRALASHHLLTASQLCLIFGYSPRSIRLLRDRLRGLQRARFIDAYPAPRATENGRAPRIYLLAHKGRRYVRALGIDLPRRHRPSEQASYGYQAIQHSIAVSDFLIKAQLFSRANPRIALEEVVHERTLARTLRGSPAIPDGWLDFRVRSRRGPYRTCLALEIDRGFHRQVAWRRKVASLLAWAAPGGGYQEQFQTSSLTILIVATRVEWSAEESARRRDQLLAWTQAELEAQGRADQTDLFRFTSVNPASASPEELFLRPNWYRPDPNRRAVPLIDDAAPAQR